MLAATKLFDVDDRYKKFMYSFGMRFLVLFVVCAMTFYKFKLCDNNYRPLFVCALCAVIATSFLVWYDGDLKRHAAGRTPRPGYGGGLDDENINY